MSQQQQQEDGDPDVEPQAPSEPTDIPEPLQAYVSDLRREAARHRTARREVEQERDTLVERVTAMQRAEAERLATAVGVTRPSKIDAPASLGGGTGAQQVVLAQAADLWIDRDLADVLDDDGNVSPEKVQEAVSAIIDARPGMGVGLGHLSLDGGVRGHREKREVGFADLLKGKRR